MWISFVSMGVAKFKMGEMLLRWEKSEEARDYLLQAKESLGKVKTEDPEHWKAQTGYLAVMDNEGMAYDKLSRYAEASAVWEEAIQQCRLMLEGEEDEVRSDTLKRYISLINLKLSEDDWREKRLDESLVHIEDSLKLHQELITKDTSRNSYRRELSLAIYKKGQLLRQLNRYREAEAALREGIQLAKQLVNENPQNLGFQRELLTVESGLGWILEHQGKVDESHALTLSLKPRYEKLLASIPDDAELRRDYVLNLQALASTGFRQGDTPLAMASLKEALKHIRKLVKDYPGRLMFEVD